MIPKTKDNKYGKDVRIKFMKTEDILFQRQKKINSVYGNGIIEKTYEVFWKRLKDKNYENRRYITLKTEEN